MLCVLKFAAGSAVQVVVLPPVTGLTQVSGRNTLSWDEKFALDVRYVDEQSFRLDGGILWRTFVTVWRDWNV